MVSLSPILALLLSLSLPSFLYAGIPQMNDWLIYDNPTKASVTSPTPSSLVLSNGLLARTFTLSPCFTTVEYELLTTRKSFFRALSPESSFTLNNSQVLLGSCLGQLPGHYQAWNPEVFNLTIDPLSFIYESYSTSAPVKTFDWTPGTWHTSTNISWPPAGIHLTVNFRPPTILPDPSPLAPLVSYPNYEFLCNQTGILSTGETCLTGYRTCDNNTVPGQCTWANQTYAIEQCTQWDQCLGIVCPIGQPTCQARGAPFAFMAGTGVNSFVRATRYRDPNLRASVHYEMYDSLPVINKYITVQTSAAAPVVVDSMVMEYLRAPNFAPEQMSILQVQANNPTPFVQQIVPDLAQSFPGRTQQLWFFDPYYDQCCDIELHVPWSYYSFLQVGYGYDTTFGGMTGPGTYIAPNQQFTSITVHSVLHDSSEAERIGLGLRKVQSKLAPQALENPLYYMITNISTDEVFELAIDQAADIGLELIVIGFGADGYCGLCDAQIENATWVAWFKSQVDYARTKGIAVSAYTLMQHNGWGETVPTQEQTLNRDGTRGPIACFATDWHKQYRTNVLNFAAKVGLAGIETDGQYENAACADDTGDHRHNGLIGSWHAQVEATASFNIGLKALNLYQTGADSYIWSGANKWNHADTDAGYHLSSFWERISVGREVIYDSTYSRLPTSGSYGLVDLTDDAYTNCNSTQLFCIDYALGSFYGQGIIPCDVSPYIWSPTDPLASEIESLYRSWTSFYVRYRTILTSWSSIHLVRPTYRTFEATAHVTSNVSNPERAFVSLYNPTQNKYPSSLNIQIPVSLYYTGIKPGTTVYVSSVNASHPDPLPVKTAIVGDDGGDIYDITVPVIMDKQSYLFYIVTLSN